MIAYVVDIVILRELKESQLSVLGVAKRLQGDSERSKVIEETGNHFSTSSIYNAFRRLRIAKMVKEIPAKGKEKPCAITELGKEELLRTEMILSLPSRN